MTPTEKIEKFLKEIEELEAKSTDEDILTRRDALITIRNNCQTLTGIVKYLMYGCEAPYHKTGCKCGLPLCPDCAHDQALLNAPGNALAKAANLIEGDE